MGRPRLTNAARLVAAAAALVATLAPAAPARAGWSEPQRFSTDVIGRVAVAADGRADAAVSTWSTAFSSAGLSIARAPAGGPFGAMSPVFPASRDERFFGEIAFAEDGAAVALFQRTRPPYPRVRAALVGADGAIGPARTISSRGHTARTGAVAVARDGRAVAAWVQYDGRRWHVEAALRAPGAERFGAVQRLGRASRWAIPAVAIGARGDALVAWGPNGGPTGDVVAAIARPQRPFAVATVERDVRVAGLHAAVADGGSVVLGFLAVLGGPERAELQVTSLGPDGDALPAPATLDTSRANGPEVENVSLALSAQGRLAMTWARSEPGSVRVFAGTAGGAVTPAFDLPATAPGRAIGTGVATDDAGDVLLATWRSEATSAQTRATGHFVTVLRPAGASAQAPAPLGAASTGGRAAALWLSGDGRGRAIWDAWDGERHTALSALLTP